jgi:hypothetical protein
MRVRPWGSLATLAADVAAAVTDGECDDVALRALVGYVTDRMFDSMRGAPAIPSGVSVPASTSLPPDVVRRVCRESVTQVWRTLVNVADGSDKEDLLRSADEVFDRANRLVASIVEAHRLARREIGYDLVVAVARELAAGRPPCELAAQARVTLSRSYAVLLLDHRYNANPAHFGLDTDRGILVAADEQDRPFVLLPNVCAMRRTEVRALCERAMRMVSVNRPMVAAAALAPSISQLPRAIDEAQTVLHVACALRRPAGVYQLHDVPIEAALLRSPDLSTVLADRLAPMYASGAPLLDTLIVYLDKSLDRRQAARALHIHPNTLDYRLRRIRDLTGLSPAVPRDIQILGAAVTAWQLTNGNAGDGQHGEEGRR